MTLLWNFWVAMQYVEGSVVLFSGSWGYAFVVKISGGTCGLMDLLGVVAVVGNMWGRDCETSF